MKRLLIAVTVLAVLVSSGLVLAQQQGSGQGQSNNPQGQGWFCPWCGQSGPQGRGMGPGGMMEQSYGQGMGQKMMHGQGMMRGGQQGMMHGQGMGKGMHRGQGMMQGGQQGMRQGCPYNQQGMQHGWGRGQSGPRIKQQQAAQPLQADQARQLAENYVAKNPNLQVGEVTDKEKEGVFSAIIETQDGSLVERLLIDKQTGWMKRQYQ